MQFDIKVSTLKSIVNIEKGNRKMRLNHTTVFKIVLVTALFIGGLGMLEGQGFAGGRGTEADPWQIATAEHLNNVRNHLNAHFIQIADVDLGVEPWNVGSGWSPIGNWNSRFTGSYDGNNHVIENLTITRNSRYQGLFGYIDSGYIRRVGLTGVNIIANDLDVGGIAARADDSTIEKCYVIGSIQGSQRVGGLVGVLSGEASFCFTEGSVRALNLISRVGGLIGDNRGGLVRDCYSKMNVTGNGELIGGLIGYSDEGSVESSYSTGRVVATNANPVHLGGLIGGSDGLVNRCYWDITSSGIAVSAGGEGAMGRTTDEMTYPYAENTYVDWDFKHNWLRDEDRLINNGYPFLEDRQFDGGSGSAYDPWQVATVQHLNNIRRYLGELHTDKHFIQTSYIDLDVAPWNEGEGWIPIGSSGNGFYGNYDGGGHVIDNLTIRRNENNQGFFGNTNSCVIKRLGLCNVDIISTGIRIGGLSGSSSNTTIEYCFVIGSVQGSEYVGGLVGTMSGEVNSCFTAGFVTATAERSYVGGLTGFDMSRNSNCYSIMDVTGSRIYIGGLIGYSNRANVTRSYAAGRVRATADNPAGVGGFIGGSYEVEAADRSYWDRQTSGQTTSAGGVGAMGRTTDEMSYPYAVNTYQGWDFQTVWSVDEDYAVNNGYPFLRRYLQPNPLTAITPSPANHSIRVSVDLEELIWEYQPNQNYTNPEGFRVYFNSTGEFNENDDFVWVIYIENQIRYSLGDILPDRLDYGRYYWMVVPTTREDGTGEGFDAIECPVWSFHTEYPEMTLQYPNGGELWLSGSTRTIRWNDDACPEVDIYISYDNGNNWNAIAENLYARGYYHYQVPTVNSTLCRIKIVSTADEDDYAISEDVFRISTSNTLPKVVLTYPSEEDIYLEVGEVVDIQWTRQNVGQVALDFSVDDGVNWSEIATGINANMYQWEVPDSTSHNCRIRVRCADDAEVLDISDNYFSISKVELLVPLGGEVITSDYSNTYSFPVSWSAPGVENVRIEYSLDTGDNWILVAASVPASEGNYNWRVPGNPTRQGLLKVANVSNTDIQAVSDSTFVIRNPVRLTNANGGGFITNNSLFNIRWEMQDVGEQERLFWEFSFNNRDWTRINEEPVAVTEESMFWFVNTGLRDDLWLRCVTAGTGAVIGKSERSLRVTDRVLILERPDGGEEFRGGTVEAIRWDFDDLTSLDICYTYDDGETWHSIAENIPANQLSYNWDVPNTPSELCRVRLQDRTHSFMVLESGHCFSIELGDISPPEVDFSADVVEGDIPLAVQFTENVDSVMGSIAERWWDFGDGNNSREENPRHVYTEIDTFTVSLRIVNSFGGDSTMTKVNYINALPNRPRISLLSEATVNFGEVYLGDTSDTLHVWIKNIGTDTLWVESLRFYDEESQYRVLDRETPLQIAVADSLNLPVIFRPAREGVISDSLYIFSDAVNMDVLAVGLRGRGEYVPPKAPENVRMVLDGYDAVITWDEVTETIYDTPIEVDCYVVLYNEVAEENEELFYFLAQTGDLTHTHFHVARHRENMFYRVVAIRFRTRSREERRRLDDLRLSEEKITWGELKRILRGEERF